eukprot:scaffold647857_cov37-Prasinocladus_malaysianus.AAC.1
MITPICLGAMQYLKTHSGPAQSGADDDATESLLSLEDGDEVECVAAMKSELDRVDAVCLAHIDETVSTVAKLREEASAKKIWLGTGTGTERFAMEMLHRGRVSGIKQAILDVYKRTFMLLQASSLNYVAMRKIQIRISEALGPEAAKRAGLPTREEIRARPFFLQLEPDSPETTKGFLRAVD